MVSDSGRVPGQLVYAMRRALVRGLRAIAKRSRPVYRSRSIKIPFVAQYWSHFGRPRYMSSAEGAAPATPPATPAPYLRKFYLRVHPDVIQRHDCIGSDEIRSNEACLAKLNSLMDHMGALSECEAERWQGPAAQGPTPLEFYLPPESDTSDAKDAKEEGPKQISVEFDPPPTDEVAVLLNYFHRFLARLLEAGGVPVPSKVQSEWQQATARSNSSSNDARNLRGEDDEPDNQQWFADEFVHLQTGKVIRLWPDSPMFRSNSDPLGHCTMENDNLEALGLSRRVPPSQTSRKRSRAGGKRRRRS